MFGPNARMNKSLEEGLPMDSEIQGEIVEELKQRGLALGHIRVYLGLEDSQLLIDDFLQALEKAYNGQ